MAQRDSIAAVEQQKQAEAEKVEAETIAATPAQPDSSALFFSQSNGEGQRIVLQNNKVKVALNSKGAVVEDAEIIGYKSRRRDGDVVILGQISSSTSPRRPTPPLPSWQNRRGNSCRLAIPFVPTPICST